VIVTVIEKHWLFLAGVVMARRCIPETASSCDTSNRKSAPLESVFSEISWRWQKPSSEETFVYSLCSYFRRVFCSSNSKYWRWFQS